MIAAALKGNVTEGGARHDRAKARLSAWSEPVAFDARRRKTTARSEWSMNIRVENDLAKVNQALTRVKSGLRTPMNVTPDSSVEERIAALANAVTILTRVVTNIADSLKHRRPGS
jgi:hypothetical protein